jgi:hypothetical protein
MSYFHRIRKVLTLPLILTLIVSTFPVTGFGAEIVSTEQLIEASILASDRTLVRDFMSREDVREQMRQLGVDPDEVMSRAGSLSDGEIQQLAGHINTETAGGDALGTIVSAALVVFLVLLITDLLCLTTFFPFTRCAR